MSEIITSSQNKFIKLAAALKQKKQRDELQLFVVEGMRLVEEAVKSNWLVETCIYTTDALGQARAREIITKLESTTCHMMQVPATLYEKITDTKEPQGIMAIVKKYTHKLSDVMVNEKQPFLLVLDELQDPGNVGTMIRTAVAAGCTGVLLTQGCTDVFSNKAVRGSMGSIFHVPIIEGLTISEIVTFMQEYGITILATSLESANVYFTVDFNKPIAIVFGNEGNGVNHQFLEQAQERLYVPLLGHVESLNVASCAAAILYEVVRQRQ